MEKSVFIENLMEFGLTRQEASIYMCILSEGKITGYEVAKLIGISRSNAYNSLASLTEKGGAYLVEEGSIRKYVPVPLEEFCRNRIYFLENTKVWLVTHEPQEAEHSEGYITIEGEENISNKIRNLLQEVQNRVYVSCTRNYLRLLSDDLERLARTQKKVIVVTDNYLQVDNVKVYQGVDRKNEIGLIIDNRAVLVGELGGNSSNTALYSGQKHFVRLYKTALANEIRVLDLKDERSQDEKGNVYNEG
ncbi:MAG: TrmB family transcriptional regulator [Lachnospiraceae bacterium]|jgi:sugar-specific transcriptional regulator TrmB|nr:TrmB family transcriptional regulator [Lachnospiraceae bacterium]